MALSYVDKGGSDVFDRRRETIPLFAHRRAIEADLPALKALMGRAIAKLKLLDG
jgi:hypothetical protein